MRHFSLTLWLCRDYVHICSIIYIISSYFILFVYEFFVFQFVYSSLTMFDTSSSQFLIQIHVTRDSNNFKSPSTFISPTNWPSNLMSIWVFLAFWQLKSFVPIFHPAIQHPKPLLYTSIYWFMLAHSHWAKLTEKMTMMMINTQECSANI